MIDEDGLTNCTSTVYYSVRYKNEYEPVVWLDDVIEAGIKALGLEEDFIFVESDFQDSDW